MFIPLIKCEYTTKASGNSFRQTWFFLQLSYVLGSVSVGMELFLFLTLVFTKRETFYYKVLCNTIVTKSNICATFRGAAEQVAKHLGQRFILLIFLPWKNMFNLLVVPLHLVLFILAKLWNSKQTVNLYSNVTLPDINGKGWFNIYIKYLLFDCGSSP